MGWFLYDRDLRHERVKGLTEIRRKSLKIADFINININNTFNF